jgi:hypothetical protein
MTQVNVDVLGDNIVGDAANEPSIAVDPVNPQRMAIGWRQFDTIQSNFRQAGYGYTTDGGQTWTFPGVIEPGVFRSDPVLDSDSQGNFYFNSLTVTPQSEFRCDVFISSDGGATWDDGTFAQGGDKQWMVIDKTGGMGDGNIYAYWTSIYSICYPGFFTRSVDGGASYEDCVIIPDEPYWGTLAVDPDGALYVCGGPSVEDFVVAKSTTAQNPADSVSWDFSTSVDLDGYFTFGGPNPGGLLGQAWIAVDHSENWTHGNVYMLSSVRRYSVPDSLDVMFARSIDGGLIWDEPVRVNDDAAPAAYQWFGTMSVAPTGRIDAIWLDTRDDPGGYGSSLYYSASYDGGVTWSANERLSEAFDPHIGWPQQNKMGDYFHMISDETGAHLAWAATFNGEQDVYYGHIFADLYVPDQYATVQAAIDAAADGNTIIVRPGIYHEHDIDFRGKAITVRSTNPLDSLVVASTIVDADSLGRVFIFTSEEDTTSVLAGLTITGGWSETEGGGIYILGTSPTITRNRITGNAADQGAGIGCVGVPPALILENSIFSNTALQGGGGISCDDSSPRISKNIINGNSSVEGVGGGILCVSEFTTIISRNTIYGNSAEKGGGIYCALGFPDLVNNTISGNESNEGGGLYFDGYCYPVVSNTILWGNTAATGAQISLVAGTALDIRYSDVQGGEDSVYVDETSSVDWQGGMLVADPLFRDAGGSDYHLMATACGDSADSPCIDTGDPAVQDSILDCAWGLGTIRSDMGAYGGGSEVTGVDDPEGAPELPRTVGLAQNYPNPFNPSTTIGFDLPGAAGIRQPVVLTVYDLRGRKVKTLVSGAREPGRHRIHWDGKNDAGAAVSSGIYLYTLHAEGISLTKKMVLLE